MLAGILKKEDGPRLWLTILLGLLVGLVALVTLSSNQAMVALLRGGYWVVLLATLIFGWALAKNTAVIRASFVWTRADRRCCVALAVMGMVLLVHESAGFKILMDEVHLLGTSMAMHVERAAFVPQRGNDLQGLFELMGGLVDKRPLFFPFLVSILHDLTGYRPENPFYLNAVLTFVLLGLSYLGGRALGGWRAGLLAALWWTGLPLLGQNTRGGGFELLNLVMILATALLAGWHYRRRDAWSLTALVYSAVLLAQTRYESPLFLAPVVAVILLVWIEDRAIRLPWLVVVSPLFLMPVPLLSRIFEARPDSWELSSKPGYSAVFSPMNIPDNTGHALAFGFNTGVEQPNSPVLVAVGLVALILCLVRLPRWWRDWRIQPPAKRVGLLFAAALLAHLGLMLCYFWGKFDDPVIRRLSLPTHLLLIFATIFAARDLVRFDRALSALLAVAAFAFVANGAPGLARQAATRLYYPALDVEWRREFMRLRPEKDYLVIDNDSTLWITHEVSATPVVRALKQPEVIAFNLRNRMFSAIYVFQRFHIDDNTGALKIKPDDDLGPAYELETVAERTFRTDTLSRLSRVKTISLTGGEKAVAVPIASVSDVGPGEPQRRARGQALPRAVDQAASVNAPASMPVVPPARPPGNSVRGILLLGLSAVASVYIAFLSFDTAACEWLVRHLGYYWMLALTLGWLVAVLAVVRTEQLSLRSFWPGRRAALVIFFAWLWLLRMDPPGYKILFDEPVQASTAFTLHQERELATTVRAYPINGLYTVLKVYLDKRPPFFPFLVATIHDLTGYRVANAFALNAAATLALLYLVWSFGRRIGGSNGGTVAVALLATLPALGVSVTGAGLDLVNLLMIAGFACAVAGYLERPSTTRASVLVFTTLLLAFTRYESVLFVGGAGLVWVWTCWRARSWLFASVWALLPLALVLYGWHNTVLSHSPALWELHEDQTQRFSFGYAANNLRHASRFLFNYSRDLPNSLLLIFGGLGGGALVLVQFFRRRSALTAPAGMALAVTALGVLANFALLMCYYWGELDDPMVTRLSLPLHLLLAWLAVAGWHEWQAMAPRWGTWRVPTLATGAAMAVFTVPALAQHRYTASNLTRRNLEWEGRVVEKFWPAPGLIITNHAAIYWLADCMSAIGFDRARGREEALRWHLERHTFGTVFVVQRVVSGGRDGGWGVDPTDRAPANWRLEDIAIRRVGLGLTRISRLVAIDPAPASTKPVHSVDADHPGLD